jgi:hypothetical protein
MEDPLGEVVGSLEDFPHSLSEVDCWIIFGVGFIDGDVNLECGDKMLLKIMKN